jgi:predicted amidohydrolase
VRQVVSRSSIRVAVVQSAPKLGDIDGNTAGCLTQMRRAAAAGCDLVVFPECALSGYMFADARAARQCAEPVPGPSTDMIAQECGRSRLHCVLGLLETRGELLHNTAVLIGPDGLVGRYRKSHIACIGADCFTVPGDEPYAVHETPIGRIGLQLCYDWRFPEITRVLALQGAEVIVHPTNSPTPARELAEFITRARAAENAVFFVTANRCGRERAASFFGWSQIVDPDGRRIAEAGAEETVIIAELNLELARKKTKEPNGGGYHVSLFGDRRPDLYAPLVTDD